MKKLYISLIRLTYWPNSKTTKNWCMNATKKWGSSVWLFIEFFKAHTITKYVFLSNPTQSKAAFIFQRLSILEDGTSIPIN